MSVATTCGVTFAILSLGLVFLSRYQLGDSFAFTPQAKSLVTHGLYSRFQHPMYLFVDLTICALALASHRWYILVPLLILVPAQIRNARRERKLLEAKFGQQYREYRRSTWI
jgi:protein-S-isoprenylcysteine O-methyltransferase Ste14